MQLQEDYDSITGLDAELLAVSVDDLSGAQWVVEELGLEFPILYDPEAAAVKEYGVFDLNGDGVAAPATFVLDKQGKVRWQYVGRSRTDRPANQRIIEELQKLG